MVLEKVGLAGKGGADSESKEAAKELVKGLKGLEMIRTSQAVPELADEVQLKDVA